MLNQTSIIEFHEVEIHFASSNSAFLYAAFHLYFKLYFIFNFIFTLYFKVFIYKSHCFQIDLKSINKSTETHALIYLTHIPLQEDLEEKRDDRFAEVMTQLVQRYLRQREKKVEETDVQKLRKELIEFSNILKEALSPS